MAQLNFDASQVAPDAGVQEALPAGWYNVAIDQSDLKPTKDGTGQYLEMRFNVIDGQFLNRKVFSRLNIRNNNPVAQEIAYKQLSAIAHAVGVLQVADSSMLHNRPLKIKVKVRAASGDYEASNEINAFKNINEQVPQPAAQAGFPPPAPAPAPQQFAQQAPAPQQAWAPQPMQQAPQYAPAPVAPAQQFAPPAQPAPAGAPPAWQAPAAAQPWQAAPQQAPVQQAAPQQAPVQQAPVQQAPVQAPPWAGQPASPVQQAPAQQYAPAAGVVPPWAQPAQ